MEVFLTELEKLRDPEAHRRELMPHQKALAYGISGEIRTQITRFRSEQDTGESYFPRIESKQRKQRGQVLQEATGSSLAMQYSIVFFHFKLG